MDSNKILILILALSIFYLFKKQNKIEKEGMTNTTGVAQADLDSIKTLAEVAKKLQTNGVDVPGQMNVKGILRAEGNMQVKERGFIEFGHGLEKQWDAGKVGYGMFGDGLNLVGGGTEAGNRKVQMWAEGGAHIHGSLNVSNAITTPSLNVSNSITTPSLTVNGGFNLLPRGVIVSWTGNDAPAGWALCNGQNGTPDLRSRFIVGAGQGSNLSNYDVGATGGAEAVTLNINQIPPHSHGLKLPNDRSNGGRAALDTDDTGPGMNEWFNTEDAGGGQAHENRPPFYALTYIMKL